MTNYKLHTPEGVKDYLPKEYAVKRMIEKNIEKTFQSFNYEFLESPTFEYIEVYEGKGSVNTKTMYKFVDRDGSVLALRPDMTPAICRIASTAYSQEDMPLRFAYIGNAFRYNEHYQGKLREFTQAGIELIGINSVEADAEILTAAIKSLLNSGLKDFRIDIGNVGFLQGVLEEAALSEDICEEIRESIISKNYVNVSDIAEKIHISDNIKEIFKKLPLLIGGREIVDCVKNMVNNQKSLTAVKHLEDIYNILAVMGLEKYISFDFSVIGHFDYYTGLVFRGYAKGTGFSVIDGGRYDNLMEKYPAVGFGIKIIDLISALEYQNQTETEKQNIILVAYDKNNCGKGFRLAEGLRNKGLIAENCLIEGLENIKAYNSKKHFKTVYYVENDKVTVFENEMQTETTFERLTKEAE